MTETPPEVQELLEKRRKELEDSLFQTPPKRDIGLITVLNDWFDLTVPYPVPDPNGVKGQCVQLIRWLLINYWKLPNWVKVDGAADFWDVYSKDEAMYKYWSKIENTPSFIPIEGDIFIQNNTKGSGYGHIGVVMGYENTVSRFVALEQNYKPLVVTRVERNYNAILGFLRRRENV